MRGAIQLLHDLTSSATPPSALPTRGAQWARSQQQRGGFRLSHLPNSGSGSSGYAEVHGSASALRTPEKCRVWHGL
jgi:hypothetical protein